MGGIAQNASSPSKQFTSPTQQSEIQKNSTVPSRTSFLEPTSTVEAQTEEEKLDATKKRKNRAVKYIEQFKEAIKRPKEWTRNICRDFVFKTSRSRQKAKENGHLMEPEQVQSQSSGDQDRFAVQSISRRTEWKSWFYMGILVSHNETKVAIAKLDTGSKVNVISEDTVKRLGTGMEVYKGPNVVPIGKSTIRPIGQVTLLWHVQNRHKTRETTFQVLDKDSTQGFDVLLSEDTIEEVGFYRVNSDVWFLSDE